MDKKQVDRVTALLEELSKKIENSFEKGFTRVVNALGGKADKLISATTSTIATEAKKEAALTARELAVEAKKAAEGRTTALRYAVEVAMTDRKIQSKGMDRIKEVLYLGLSTTEKNAKVFYTSMTDKVKKGFESFSNMMKGTMKGIVQIFTGPFYGLVARIGGIIGPTLGKIFAGPISLFKTGKDWFKEKVSGVTDKMSGWVNKKIYDLGYGVLNKMLGKEPGKTGTYAPPPVRGQTQEEKLLEIMKASKDILGDIRDLSRSSYTSTVGIGNLLAVSVDSMKSISAKIMDSIYFATDYLGDSIDKLGKENLRTGVEFGTPPRPMAKGGMISKMGAALLHPAEIITPAAVLGKTQKYQDFMREQAIITNEYLKKILKEEADKGGGLLSNFGPKVLNFMSLLTKRLPIIGAIVGGGLEAFNVYKESRAGGMSKKMSGAHAAARGAVTGAGAYVGAAQGATLGATIGTLVMPGVGTVIGGLAGGTMGMIAGGAIGHYFGKWASKFGGDLGIKLFDAKELIGRKFSDMSAAVSSKFSDAKDYITGTFTKIGAGFKSSTEAFKKSVMSYFPSGESISDTLKSILSGLMNVGPVVIKYATATARSGMDAAKQAADTAKQVGSRGVESVKKAFNIGGSRWKAETKGVNPQLMKAFNDAAIDYKKQTGKTATLTEGVRTRDQQAVLSKDNKYMTAKPGMSVHEKGFALDVNSMDAREMERLGILAKHGLTRPYGEKDPVHMELAALANAKERAKIRAGKTPTSVASVLPPAKPKLQAAATGALVNRGGALEVHPAEVVSPISKFTEMLSKTATGMAAPAIANNGLGPDVIKYLSMIATSINKLVESDAKGETSSSTKRAANPPVPDFPGDPGVIFGGNYFPQKGRQWG